MGEKQIYNAGYRDLMTYLKATRKRLGLKQEDAARRIGMSRNWLSKVESCELRLDLLHLVRVCKAYGLKARDMIETLEKSVR